MHATSLSGCNVLILGLQIFVLTQCRYLQDKRGLAKGKYLASQETCHTSLLTTTEVKLPTESEILRITKEDLRHIDKSYSIELLILSSIRNGGGDGYVHPRVGQTGFNLTVSYVILSEMVGCSSKSLCSVMPAQTSPLSVN